MKLVYIRVLKTLGSIPIRVRVPSQLPPQNEVVTSQGQPWHKQSITITPLGVNFFEKTIVVTDFCDTFIPMNTQTAIENPEMQLPLIHLNGNDGRKLGQQYFEALKALIQFQDVFEQIEFHSRDYYPLGDEAWLKARAQRQVQWTNIGSLKNYLGNHAQHCVESTKE
jgi:hypothetical protein